MIAQPKLAPPPPRQTERVTIAARRRVRRTRRRVHGPAFAMIALAVLVLVPLLGYVTLTSNLTSLSYARSRAERERTALMDDSQRLDDKIARLTSSERLSQLAAQLKMHDPHVYAVVSLPQPKVQPKATGIAFFGWITARER